MSDMAVYFKMVTDLARKLMDQHGLQQWRFCYDSAVSRAGACHHRKKVISLSVNYVSLNKMVDIRDTILHEIAHAIAGPRAKHGPEWVSACLVVGAKPERCYDADRIVMPKGRWQAKCPSCSKIYYKHRRPKRLDGWYCLKCGQNYGLLTWTSS